MAGGGGKETTHTERKDTPREGAELSLSRNMRGKLTKDRVIKCVTLSKTFM